MDGGVWIGGCLYFIGYLGKKQKEIKMEPFIFFHNYKLNL